MKTYYVAGAYESEQRERLARKERMEKNAKHTQLTKAQLEIMFKFVGSFEITIKKDYAHATQLSRFSQKYGPLTIDREVTDNNFCETSHQLEPMKTYLVKLYEIQQDALARDILDLYASQNTYLVGSQGLATLWEERKNLSSYPKWCHLQKMFKKDVRYYSFDTKRNLPYTFKLPDLGSPCHLVPYAYFTEEYEYVDSAVMDYERCIENNYLRCADFDALYKTGMLVLFC